MTTRAINVSTINRKPAHASTAAGERGPTMLTESDLDHVAAAGSKKGASGAAGFEPPRPSRPK